MQSSALIIFVRNPVPGRVKTRLAKTIGDDHALLIYLELLRHTRSITSELACDKFVFYDDQVNDNDLWENDNYYKKNQSGKDLGARMSNAFSGLFASGYERILIIGSDCYELTTDLLNKAFEKLNVCQVVVGPAMDGGYYMLGMRELLPELFTDLSWGTATVLQETLSRLNNRPYSSYLLPQLSDVDEADDLSDELKINAGLQRN